MDESNAWAHADAVLLGKAVLDRVLEQGHTQEWLAEQLGRHESWVSRLVNGKNGTLTIAQLRRIEEVLRLRKGDLFVAGNLVEAAMNVEDAVRQDKRLKRAGRDAVLAVYQRFAEETEGR